MYPDPYYLAYGIFAAFLLLFIVIQRASSISVLCRELGAYVLSNLIASFSKQRVADCVDIPFEVPRMEDESTRIKSKRYICCGEVRNPYLESWLADDHFYHGIPDIYFPNGQVHLITGHVLSFTPGLLEDLLFTLFNYDPLIGTFSAHLSNPHSTFARKFIWITDISLALLFYGIIYRFVFYLEYAFQFFIGFYLYIISEFNRYIYVCPCLVKSDNACSGCTRQFCRFCMYIQLLYVVSLALVNIQTGVTLVVDSANSQYCNDDNDVDDCISHNKHEQDKVMSSIGSFFITVLLVDLSRRMIATVLQYSTTNGLIVLLLDRFVVFSYGVWSIEKYHYGALDKHVFVIKREKRCCGCLSVIYYTATAADNDDDGVRKPLINPTTTIETA